MLMSISMKSAEVQTQICMRGKPLIDGLGIVCDLLCFQGTQGTRIRSR